MAETLNINKDGNNVNRMLGFLKKTGKTDLQSQINFMEFMNNELIKTPVFMAIIQSLKELQSIKG